MMQKPRATIQGYWRDANMMWLDGNGPDEAFFGSDFFPDDVYLPCSVAQSALQRNVVHSTTIHTFCTTQESVRLTIAQKTWPPALHKAVVLFWHGSGLNAGLGRGLQQYLCKHRFSAITLIGYCENPVKQTNCLLLFEQHRKAQLHPSP